MVLKICTREGGKEKREISARTKVSSLLHQTKNKPKKRERANRTYKDIAKAERRNFNIPVLPLGSFPLFLPIWCPSPISHPPIYPSPQLPWIEEFLGFLRRIGRWRVMSIDSPGGWRRRARS